MEEGAESRYLPRKMPVQSRSKATVDAILGAATRVLLEAGYDHATTNLIAERAGIGIGSLYEYFPGKEAIYAALIHRLNEQMFQAMVTQMGDISELSPAAAIDRVVEARILSVQLDTQLYVALRCEIPEAVTKDQTDQLLETFQAISVGFLELNQASVRARPAQLISDVAMRAMYAIVEDLAIHAPEKLSDVDYINELKHLLRRYILAD